MSGIIENIAGSKDDWKIPRVTLISPNTKSESTCPETRVATLHKIVETPTIIFLFNFEAASPQIRPQIEKLIQKAAPERTP
jgi:hypothetical protein